MALKDLLKKAFCVLLFLGSTLSEPDTARDFTQRALRVSNTDELVNSVLGRLEQNHQDLWARERIEEEDCNEPSETFPEYTKLTQGARERGARQQVTQKHHHICYLDRTIKTFKMDEYEYRPAFFEEIRCSNINDDDVVGLDKEGKICSKIGLSCVQLNKTIHLTRRRYSSDCWETKTMVIPAGCECMYPSHKVGGISFHV